MLKKLLQLSMVGVLLLSIVGCSSPEEKKTSYEELNHQTTTQEDEMTLDNLPTVEIQFGENTTPFTLQLEKNQTALTLARNITEAGRNLPIYHYDDFEDYQVMQYYDIPSTYTIPSTPQTLTKQKAGDVYYVAPNRIVLFYQDANIEGEYTKIGTINNVSQLRLAVENNPVLEGWGNKLILVRYVD